MSTQSDRVAALAAEGLSLRDIGRRLGVSKQRVSQIVKKHGIERRDLRKDARGSPLSDQTKRILKAAPALAKKGLTKSEAAREMGVSPFGLMHAVSRHLPDVEWRKGQRQVSNQTKRIIEAVPALAARGLTKAEAARELGVRREVFTVTVHRHLPDVEWCYGRAGRPFADQTKRILDAAPGLAERGLSKLAAARELGVPPKAVRNAVSRYLPEVEWRDGRARAPSTVKDDGRSTTRRVMGETLAEAKQPPARDGGIGR